MFETFVICMLILITIAIAILAIRMHRVSKLRDYNPNPLIGGGLKGRVDRMIHETKTSMFNNNRIKKAASFTNNIIKKREVSQKVMNTKITL